MARKLMLVGGIIAFTIAAELLITIFIGPINSFVGIASADPAIGNFTAYEDALNVWPILVYLITPVLAVIAIIITLRSGESR